jgi:hypothetical protein
MKRPSARFSPAMFEAARERAIADLRLAKRRAVRSSTLALFEPAGVELYSVQVARSVGCAIGYAACILKLLERDGVLVSRLEPSPTSGNGRRIYRRAT